MNPWIQAFLAGISAMFGKKTSVPIEPMPPDKAREFKATIDKLREEAGKYLSVPSKLTAHSKGWEKLAKDLDIAPPIIDKAKLQNAEAIAEAELMRVAWIFAESCSVNADGTCSPPTEETDKKIVDLQTAAIAYATAFRECMKANIDVNGCQCLRCVFVRFAAIGYGNCPPECDPAYVAVAFINLMRAVKILAPVIVIRKPTANPQTPFSHS